MTKQDLIKNPTKRWLVMAGRNNRDVIAEYDTAELAYKKANEKPEYCVWLLHLWQKSTDESTTAPAKRKLGS